MEHYKIIAIFIFRTLEVNFPTSGNATVKTNDDKMSDLFSGLGLDNYLSGSGTSVAAPTPPAALSSGDAPKELASSLSLQEKQR